MRRGKGAATGQADIFGTIHGLDKLVYPPSIIESEGLRVVHFVVSEDDRAIPGYFDEARKQARRLLPETKSRGKPPWMRAEWQAKRRKETDAARQGT